MPFEIGKIKHAPLCLDFLVVLQTGSAHCKQCRIKAHNLRLKAAYLQGNELSTKRSPLSQKIFGSAGVEYLLQRLRHTECAWLTFRCEAGAL